MLDYYLLVGSTDRDEEYRNANIEGHSTATVNLRKVSSSDMPFSSS